MKRILSLLLALVLCLNLVAPVAAIESTVEDQEPDISDEDAIVIVISDLEDGDDAPEEIPQNTVQAGITPGSFFYFFDKLLEDIQLALAKTPEAKAALFAAISKERLAEIEALDPAKLEAYLDSLLDAAAAALQRAADAVSEAKQNGADVTDLVAKLEQALTLSTAVTLPEEVQKTQEPTHPTEHFVKVVNSVKVQAAVIKGVKTEIVADLRSQGLGYGQIALLNKLASAIEAEEDQDKLERVMAVFKENKSLGKTMHSFGTNPGQLNKAEKNIQTPTSNKAEDKPPATGKGNTKGKGK